MKRSLLLVLTSCTLSFAALAALAPEAPAQERTGPPRPEGQVAGSGQAARERTLIQWFGTLEGARAEARRTGRAILLVSAAPQCHGVSGVW